MITHPIVQLFYNPAAGSFSGAKVEALIQAFGDGGTKVIKTPSVNSTAAVDPCATHLCIAGGAGTIRHVGMMLVRAKVRLPLVVLPMGTINLLAREYVADPGPAFAAHSLLHGLPTHHTHPVTLTFPEGLGHTMFLVCASVGPDSLAMAQVSTKLKARIGRMAYAVALLKVVMRWDRSSS